ncbi:DUF3667 domain-containing protein [Marinigracilibium pacificum]|uniref:DUF3667 domain-containing protein n=1 Tax=Marinigracilibium pacificum TaxID=2729599 RepID=A0A848J0E5_9BACT|nr:DUF3667 domain-containing protein [Marinigracilibium pacificum]NMM47739.1 DUF3667 domain-containing protein [Marinigracilibium pacificum]
MSTNTNIECKNCKAELHSEDLFCSKCGAEIINEKVTLKYLLSGLYSSLGWDNRFWTTLRKLITNPGHVFEKYLKGTRKMYSPPFTFFAIAMTIYVLIIGFNSQKIEEITFPIPKTEERISTGSQTDSKSLKNTNDYQEKSASVPSKSNANIKKLTDFIKKHYFHISFLLLPLYALIAYLVFGKPDNYAEHLIINSYINGIIIFSSIILLIITLITNLEGIFTYGQYAIILLYYAYAYHDYRNYTIKTSLKKSFKFFLIFSAFFILFTLVAVVYAIISVT